AKEPEEEEIEIEVPEAPEEGEGEGEEASPRTGVRRKLFINAEDPEEIRIALVEAGRLEGFQVKTISRSQTKGNIYKGRIVSIEPGLQAAFVDIGLPKNGFLSFAEIHPEYYAGEVEPDTHWRDLKIQDVVRKGQEVLVQVVKEATETKGANLTTYLSLPGRFLVLMPGSDSAGISRKIEGEAQRQGLRQLMEGLELPEGIGYILRTASEGITKTALAKDLRFLLRLWDEVKKRGQEMAPPTVVFEDQDIINRFLRDSFTADIEEIVVDSREVHDQVQRFLAIIGHRTGTRVRLHKSGRPLFHHYELETQIEQIYQPRVPLPSGGSIVIDPTEALVAIDVNSGRTSKDKDFEETIFLANMEAAREAARQLRLRDLGGLIVIDFIDLGEARHIRELEKEVKSCLKADRAKTSVSKISRFGLMQISRQKLGAPVQSSSYRSCPHCHGRGVIRSAESQALICLRQIQTAIAQKKPHRILCRLPLEVANYLTNRKRAEIVELETSHRVEIVIQADPTLSPSETSIELQKG
ncbi:MAG: Rne/Rng family ribonuclease, partial [Thermodesulfobacteriota bacterium]